MNLVLNLPSANAFPPARVRCTAVVVRQGDGARAALAIERYRFLRPEDRG